jgi:hypothetical protein
MLFDIFSQCFERATLEVYRPICTYIHIHIHIHIHICVHICIYMYIYIYVYIYIHIHINVYRERVKYICILTHYFGNWTETKKETQGFQGPKQRNIFWK